MRTPIILTAAALMSLGFVQSAQADHYAPRLDRLEDRIDRRESRRDERVDLGRRDVIEDRVDRIESRRDRLGKPTPHAVNRWERRSWRKRWAH